ncbi:MAG TPA: YdbL family protein [Micavibrio sp.]|jgi:hypothetical protein
MKLRFLSVMIAAGLLMASGSAFALDLHDARHAGMVGEKLDGYVAVLKGGAEVEALAKDVNSKRKLEYARISNENKQPIDVVAKVAAEQIINKLEPGDQYQAADGSWKTR